jgi:hypothetical protein
MDAFIVHRKPTCDTGWRAWKSAGVTHRALRGTPAQYLKALRAGEEHQESDLSDFQELPAPVAQAQVRQDFSPPEMDRRKHNCSPVPACPGGQARGELGGLLHADCGAGVKTPAQYLKALRAGEGLPESDLSDFQELRQDFSPPEMDRRKHNCSPVLACPGGQARAALSPLQTAAGAVLPGFCIFL